MNASQFGNDLTPEQENRVNAVGDRLADVLGMKVDNAYSPDAQGRIRWQTAHGNKTGLGLLRTILHIISEESKKLG